MAQMSSILNTVMPYVGAAANLANTVQTVRGAVQDPYKQQRKELRDRQNLSLKQLQDRQNISLQQVQEDSALQKDKIIIDRADQEKSRRAALKRAVARQRAKFGGQNIGVNSGSGEAVLLGLFEESEEEKKKRDKLDKLRFKSINQNVKNKKSLNLLQTTQLKQKYDLENLYSD